MPTFIIVETRKHSVEADTGQEALDDYKANGANANGYVDGGVDGRYVTDDDGDFVAVNDNA